MRLISALLFLLLTLQACNASRLRPPDFAGEINRVAGELASEVAASMKAEGKIGFAVFPICYKGHPCLWGERLATVLQKKVSEAKPGAEAVISEEEMEDIPMNIQR